MRLPKPAGNRYAAQFWKQGNTAQAATVSAADAVHADIAHDSWPIFAEVAAFQLSAVPGWHNRNAKLPAAMRHDRSSAVPSCLTRLATLAATAALCGCVAQYRVPSGAPTASVRLLTNTEDITSFAVVDPAKCPVPARPLILAGTGKQLSAMGRDRELGLPGRSPEPPARTRERLVEAGRRIYVAVTSVAEPPLPEQRCAAGVSFVPAPGGLYEIRYQRDEAASQCSAQVLRMQPLEAGGARLTAEPTQQGFRALRKEYVCQAL